MRSIGLANPDLLQPGREPVIYIEIEPRPLLPGEAARYRASIEKPRVILALPGTRSAASPLRSRMDDDDQVAPATRPLAAPPPGPLPLSSGVEDWVVRPGTPGDRIGRGLRTRGPGCNSPALLSAAERAICDDRFGRRAAAAPPLAGTGNPERDARFAQEGARRLADYDRRRRSLSGRPGVSLTHDCGGSNLGFSCAGGHLRPEFRQDVEATLNQNLGADRDDPDVPRLPRAGQTDD
ncbi:MAG TPA: hypothetical protein VFF48_08375 [Brevundimonas sp.]|nr:hypothetical protein [Brevundimonas sp.]